MPSLLWVSPLVVNTVKVVPSDVEQSAAPAANACNEEMWSKHCSTKENAIGALMPTEATVVERRRFALSVLKFVDNPPTQRTVREWFRC